MLEVEYRASCMVGSSLALSHISSSFSFLLWDRVSLCCPSGPQNCNLLVSSSRLMGIIGVYHCAWLSSCVLLLKLALKSQDGTGGPDFCTHCRYPSRDGVLTSSGLSRLRSAPWVIQYSAVDQEGLGPQLHPELEVSDEWALALVDTFSWPLWWTSVFNIVQMWWEGLMLNIRMETVESFTYQVSEAT